MSSIVSIDSDNEGLVIELTNDEWILLSKDGMTFRTASGSMSLDWKDTDRVTNLARGAKVIYANGQIPRLVENG